jgi:hypothetical protein
MPNSRSSLSAQECRESSRQSRELAERTTDPLARETLLSVAAAYYRLALKFDQEQWVAEAAERQPTGG